MRWLCTVVCAAMLTSAAGCATARMSQEQRAECREARARAAGRAVGYTVGFVLLIAVLALARGSSGSIGGRGGRARRGGLSVCRRPPPPLANAQTLPVAAHVQVAPGQGPPSREQIGEALGALEASIAQCAPGASGALVVDADVGGHGRVVRFSLDGPAAPRADPRCVAAALGRVQVPPFHGEIRVRAAFHLAP